ncbi:MAG: hypothetical protein GXO15_03920, partial [Crenarchaeota archaeon]|nr:hypothetical protein [Thermoproteota archaeon]
GGSALAAAAYSLALGLRLLRGGGCCGEPPGALFAAATVGVVAPVWPLSRLALAPFYLALLAASDREMRYVLASTVLLAASAVWAYEGFRLDAGMPLVLRGAYAAAAAATLFMEYLLARRLGLRTAPLRLAAAAALAAYTVPSLAGDELASTVFGVAAGYVAALLAAGYAAEEMSARRAGG